MLPPSMASRRNRLGTQFLSGDGIEIGALDSPLGVSPQAKVRYVDRVTVARLREYYPELGKLPLVEPDVIDDGETLSCFGEGTLDFIIANHMLEHCEDPIGTVRVHLSRLKPGGLLFYSVPDKRFSFDRDRANTPFEHLLADEFDRGASSRSQHYDEWAREVNKITDPEVAQRNARENERNGYSIHFHVWDEDAFRQFLRDLVGRSGLAFTIDHFERNETEVIVLLRKPH